jgi:hypothetical protein
MFLFNIANFVPLSFLQFNGVTKCVVRKRTRSFVIGRSIPQNRETAISQTQITGNRLGDVMVGVTATGPNAHGFKSDREHEFLRAIKIRSTNSFGGEVKSTATFKALRHVKITSKCEQRRFEG